MVASDCIDWTTYLRSDLPGLGESTVNHMLMAYRYIERREADVIDAAVDTDEGSLASQRQIIPSYRAIVALNTLTTKVEKGVIPKADAEELHRKAFDGELTDNETRSCQGGNRLSETVGVVMWTACAHLD